MLFNSGRLNYAKGRNPISGGGVAGGLTFQESIKKHVERWGINSAEWQNIAGATADKKAEKLSKHTGMVLKPFDGAGGEITTDVPYEYEGKTYMVNSKTGLKIVNKDLLGDVVSQAIEREEYINDITELLLYAGDMAVAAIDKSLYDELEGGVSAAARGLSATNVLPSSIRNTVGNDAFGDKVLEMKKRIAKHIDRIVFPETVLEMLRAKRIQYGRNNIDMRRLISTGDGGAASGGGASSGGGLGGKASWTGAAAAGSSA
jgi:hypothetical protein